MMVRGCSSQSRDTVVARRTDKGAPGTWREEILWSKRAKIVDQLEPDSPRLKHNRERITITVFGVNKECTAIASPSKRRLGVNYAGYADA